MEEKPPSVSISEENENKDDDEDLPQLSVHTLAALQEFYKEQETLRELLEKSTLSNSEEGENIGNGTGGVKTELFNNDLNRNFPEDWQLSQFWYDDETSSALANEVLKQGINGKVACISCPSIFRACGNAPNVHLFEFDKRFSAFGSLFHFYDYNKPEDFPETCQAAFSIVVVDPPFLSEECLEKVAITVNKLVEENGKIILCTGAIMEPVAERVLNLKRSTFVPKHAKNLGNEFACFANYEMNMEAKV